MPYRPDSPIIEQAKTFLTEVLAGGARPLSEIQDEAVRRGLRLPRKALDTARRVLGIPNRRGSHTSTWGGASASTASTDATSADATTSTDATSIAERKLPVLQPPRTRADCAPGGPLAIRPCPWTECRHHLTTKDGTFSGCVLDVVEREGSMTLSQIGNLIGLTREAVRQIETKARRNALRVARRQRIDLKALLAGWGART